MLKKDCYKTLNIAPIATLDEIKKAYRDLSKKYHPDLNPDLKLYSDEKMKELVEAYNILNDKDKRHEYDAQPQFQLKKSRKSSQNEADKLLSSSFTQKPQYKKEGSLLERIFSPFQKEKQNSHEFKIDSKQADVHFTLGLSMSENIAFYEQAIAEFGLACKFLPTFIEAMYNMGVMNYRKGYFEDAIISFHKVLASDKTDANAVKMINLLREEY